MHCLEGTSSTIYVIFEHLCTYLTYKIDDVPSKLVCRGIILSPLYHICRFRDSQVKIDHVKLLYYSISFLPTELNVLPECFVADPGNEHTD